jgi:hypothetical protein
VKTAAVLFAVCAAGAIVTATGGLAAGLTYYALIAATVGFATRARS